MTEVLYTDCGFIPYKEAWDLQSKYFNEAGQTKLYNRNNPDKAQIEIPNRLFFCEHNHVYTLGKSGSEENLLIRGEQMIAQKIEFFHINRGGDITYHGPGQITGYPIFDLEQFFTDLHKYMRFLEDVIILTMADYGISCGRIPGLTGVWVNHLQPDIAKKICALGVHMSRWMTMHGFGLNVNTDLSMFDFIIPCGITDKGVTSMQKELGRNIDMNEVKEALLLQFEKVFDIKILRNEQPISIQS